MIDVKISVEHHVYVKDSKGYYQLRAYRRHLNSETPTGIYSAPSLTLLTDWLRDKKIDIEIRFGNRGDDGFSHYLAEIFDAQVGSVGLVNMKDNFPEKNLKHHEVHQVALYEALNIHKERNFSVV